MHRLIALILLLPAIAFSQAENARKTVEKLCSSEFHGRGYVNGGDSIAADYIAAQFRETGCSFFNAKPFQRVNFRVNTFPDRMQLSIGGKYAVPGADFVTDPSSGGGRLDNARAVIITQQDFDSRESLKSKWGEITSSENDVVAVFDFPGYTDSTKKLARTFVETALAVCPVIELTGTKFTWSVSDEQRGKPHIIAQRSLFDLTDPSLTVSMDITAVLRKHSGRNVMAYVPAKKNSKKFIVYTAHYDHLGRMGQQTYFPGANDNASGTAMLLELARWFKQNPQDVNVAFIAFCGEEAGLLGSHEYVQHPVFPLDRISFLFNIDIMGSGEEGATVVNATKFPAQFDLLKKINDNGKYLVKIAPRGEAANSDHYFFTKAGVPAFFLYTMGPNKHYHDIYDTYSELSFAEFDDLFHLLTDFGVCVKRL
jgi:aminopeptidase YwaD